MSSLESEHLSVTYVTPVPWEGKKMPCIKHACTSSFRQFISRSLHIINTFWYIYWKPVENPGFKGLHYTESSSVIQWKVVLRCQNEFFETAFMCTPDSLGFPSKCSLSRQQRMSLHQGRWWPLCSCRSWARCRTLGYRWEYSTRTPPRPCHTTQGDCHLHWTLWLAPKAQ